MHGNSLRLRGECQAIVRGGCNDLHDVDAVVDERVEHGCAEIAGADEGDLHKTGIRGKR